MACLTSVVAGGEGAEAFLAGCVPNLELDDIVFVLDVLEFEVNANGVEKVLVEGIFCVAQQEATLADTTVANDQHFEEVVATQAGSTMQGHLLILTHRHGLCLGSA